MDTQEQILLSLGELKGKMDALLTSRNDQGERIKTLEDTRATKQDVDDVSADLELVEQRVDKLEASRAWLYGAIAASGAAGVGLSELAKTYLGGQ